MGNPAPIPTHLKELHQKVDALASRVEHAKSAAVDTGGGGGHPPGMDDPWRTKVDDRLLGVEKGLLELKGDISGMKVAVAALASMIAIGSALLSGVVYNMGGRIDRVETKLDALGPRLTEEFRAMRAEMSAQTSAIANSITATKQQAPQVILVPAPPPPAPQQ